MVPSTFGGPRRSAVTAGRLGHMSTAVPRACQRVSAFFNTGAEMASHNSAIVASMLRVFTIL